MRRSQNLGRCHAASLSGALCALLTAGAAAAADPIPLPPAASAPCSGLPAGTAADCQHMLSGHTVPPSVVAVCNSLITPAAALRCLTAAADKSYPEGAVDWCRTRNSVDDVVSCFALTGQPIAAAAAPLYTPPPPPAPAPAATTAAAWPPAPAPAPAGTPAPAAAPTTAPAAAAPPAAAGNGRPATTAAAPRGTAPELRRAPPSTLDRVGHDIRNAVESPGEGWLERVGRDVRGGAQTLGENFRPTAAQNPAPAPTPPAAPAPQPGKSPRP